MSWFSESFGIKGERAICPNVICEKNVRVSVITERLFRVEYSPCSKFCDSPTQSVLYRDLGEVKYKCDIKGDILCVNTKKARLIISLLTGEALQAKMALRDKTDGEFKSVGVVSDFHAGNLGGTVRTLDKAAGAVKLGEGVVSRSGAAVLDDSSSLVLCEDGRVLPRHNAESDKYYFLYGEEYIKAVQDFYKIAGSTPLIPRYALGNWWSRYKAYTQDEYLALMRRFKKEEIPITVATVDMDWHWTHVTKKFGKKARNTACEEDNRKEFLFDYIVDSGWTGYSWNTDLFPDYKAFLKELGEMGLKTTLNLHPATGVRFFEDMYGEFAEFMGIDKESKKKIPFDITNPKFVEGYFRFLHHPYEKDGVDFWWLDWQQGTKTKIKGLDPLWALNHYHLLDNGKNGKRGLILSRFAGAGSHRYPLGFSGDTVICWESLKFQPYFTSTASNIGYTWWSHDIGGHMKGITDDELYTRWVQYGVFSPIMRLHSSNNEFMGKEVWKYSDEASRNATNALRFRHKLLPYIYTMNYRTATEGRALAEPMYYHYPSCPEAYKVPNEYYFGSELIVAPITEPRNKKSLLAGTKVWLPKGRYTDIFTGRVYKGGKVYRMYRDMSSIPVLAKAGAIIPLNSESKSNSWGNPEELEIFIYSGNGDFILYEDDGESENYKKGAFVKTHFALEEKGADLSFCINAPEGDLSLIPAERTYTLRFKDVSGAKSLRVYKNGKRIKADVSEEGECVNLNVILKGSDKIKITLSQIKRKGNPPKREALCELISRFQGSNLLKPVLFNAILKGKKSTYILPDYAVGPIKEIEDLYE